ncbi:glutathione S-transferase C-terminal domain-containing protein [Paraburkholderia sediminicola]|uniref:glutathione S-transferase C-terminal domain-containing protein n=1 Tax=Paraburkholderia sediminicola TaxID=458836 RepID=UPI0038BCF0FF
MNDPITLHGYYRSSASFRVRIALNLKAIAYEDAFHHLRRGEHYLRKTLHQPEDAIKDWYNRWIADGFEAIEGMLATSPETGRFCHGDSVTMADVCLVPQVVDARNFDLDMTAFPILQRISGAALALPAFERAMPSNQKDFE